MKCPKCQFENPDDKKFCLHCGEKLALKCPSCGSESPPGSKFCGDCGQELAAPSVSKEPTPISPSFEEKIENISATSPEASPIRSSPRRERSKVNENRSR